MEYIIEGYPQFTRDVTELWKCLITTYNFTVKEKSWEETQLISNKCVIKLLLNSDQTISYFFINPESKQQYESTLLYLFFKKPFDRVLVGDKNYPISSERWIELYAEDNFQAICRIDLLLLKEEILNHWKNILNGDFSFEEDYIKWYEDYIKNKPEDNHDWDSIID
ncbi:MAG: hypothetical protein ACK4ND_03830 [Cytophagaceae bacterium]